jgi:predicted secreted protein
MSISASLAIYFIFWWLVFFTVLPIGIRSHVEEGYVEKGTEGGAPVSPAIPRKMAITTVISAILFAFFYYAIANDLIDFENLPNFQRK